MHWRHHDNQTHATCQVSQPTHFSASQKSKDLNKVLLLLQDLEMATELDNKFFNFPLSYIVLVPQLDLLQPSQKMYQIYNICILQSKIDKPDKTK